MKLVSAIITTRNSSRTLEACLLSLRLQTYSAVELVVVDNKSSDDTPVIAKRLADVFLDKGPERSAQRNFGASVSHGEYLLIHDSDVYFPPDAIAECVSAIERDGADALILPERSIGSGYWAKVKAFERSFYLNNDYIEGARFFRRSSYERLGGYDETLTGPEDWDLTIRFREAGLKISRTTTLLDHDEGRLFFWGVARKKAYYAASLDRYKNKHPHWFGKQMSFFCRFPLVKLTSKGLRHPILLSSMILMKGSEYFWSKFRQAR